MNILRLIAIHNSGDWNAKWIEYCQERSIPYKALNCYDSGIIDQIRDCSGLMWRFMHSVPEDILAARNVLNAAEAMGLKVYPNSRTNWHYDDKLSQKYLFEALELSAAPSWAFFDFGKAMGFARDCALPIVAKLRCGACSYNVRLLEDRRHVYSYVRRMFSKGFSPAPAPLADVKTKFKVAVVQGGSKGVLRRLKKAPNFFRVAMKGRKLFGNEKGYAYFQKFVPGNTCDYRIKVVGDVAWGFRRMVRENDFRASGGGMLDFDHEKIPEGMIRLAFDSADKLKMQSVAFDFVTDENENYLMVEVSYAFAVDAGESDGYWDRQLQYHDEEFEPTSLIIETFLKEIA